MLTPEYTASATLTGVGGGELVVAPADTSLAVTLIPFMRGEKGDAGAQGIQGQKGDKGDTGPAGMDGAQGIQGQKGDKGDTGEQGIQGDTGAAGGVALVDFGTTVASSATVTVPCDWVTVNSVIMLAPSTIGTADNDGDEHLYGEFTLLATNVVSGVGFDILMESTTKFGFKGTFKINWAVIN